MADIFTKGLIGAQFSMLVDKLGMINIFSLTWRSVSISILYMYY